MEMDRTAIFRYESNMHDGARPNAIATYNLFGESADLPDVVHCETIAARSALHDWDLRPHRHGHLHQILVIVRGGGSANLDGRIRPLGPGQFVNVPVGDVHGFSFTPETEGWVATLAAEMLDEVLAPGEGLAQALSHARTGPATPAMIEAMTQIFAEFEGRQFGRAQVLRSLCGLLAGLVARETADAEASAGPADRSDLLGRFEALLEAGFLEHLSVADYADALGVTPTHLSRIARAARGRSASHIIRERIIREARRHLVYTGMPISGIAYALGFGDPAYFTRVFAAATGLSPRAFRARFELG